jgi:membrane protein DedA with SNARE-associated domain
MPFSLVGSVVELVILVLAALGLPGLFALTAVEGFGIPPIPSEVILPFAGFLVAQGTFPFYGAVLAAVLGELVGAYAAYAVGRRWRHRIERIGVGALRLEPKHLESMDRFFARRGEATVALARLIPVVRSYISYPAGTAKMPPVRFGAYTVAGLLPFEVTFVYLGVVLRSHWGEIESLFGWLDYAVFGIVVVAGVYLYLVLAERVAPGWPVRRTGPERPPKVPRP